MRHRNKKPILNRPLDQRKSLIRNLLTSLFLYGKVETTHARAKALISEAEKLISRVKHQKEEFNSLRELQRILYTEESSRKAWEYISASHKTSGFLRSVKNGTRAGDGASLVHVQLIFDSKSK